MDSNIYIQDVEDIGTEVSVSDLATVGLLRSIAALKPERANPDVRTASLEMIAIQVGKSFRYSYTFTHMWTAVFLFFNATLYFNIYSSVDNFKPTASDNVKIRTLYLASETQLEGHSIINIMWRDLMR